MFTRWRGGPATAIAILIVVCLLMNTVYVGPANATTDYLNAPPAGVTWDIDAQTPTSLNTVAEMKDADDTTFWRSNFSTVLLGGCHDVMIRWRSHAVMTTPMTITAMRFKAATYDGSSVCNTGSAPAGVWCLGDSGLTPSVTIPSSQQVTVTGGGPWDNTVTIDHNGTAAAACTAAVGQYMYLELIVPTANPANDADNVYTLEAQAGVTATATDYIYNLVASHPPFARHYTWNWVRTYTGTWYVTNGAGTHLPCTIGCQQYLGDSLEAYSLNAGGQSGLEVGCLVICGHDTYTIYITETGVGTTTYAIDSDLDGTLIGTPQDAHITAAQACYQKTASSCASKPGFSWASISSTAGQAFVNYTFTGASTYTYTVAVGQSGQPPFGTVGRTPGSYTLFLPVSTSLPAQLYLTVTGAGGRYVVADMVLDFSTDSVSAPVTEQPDQGVATPPPVCDAIAVVCNLQQLFAAPGAALNALALSTVQSIRATMLTRQPFNFIVRAYDGVSGQLALASAAVTTTSTCTGLVLTVPIGATGTWRPNPYGWALPTQPPATSMPVTVADCASLEPVGGTSWYQAIRAAEDPAIYLLFAYSQLRRLQPRPVLAA